LGISCDPFKNVSYFYPYAKHHSLCSNTTLSPEILKEQHKSGKAHNYVYTFNHDFAKIDMLFSNIDDPNFTIESILNFIETDPHFRNAEMTWGEFKKELRSYVDKSKSNKEIMVQSWRKFSRLVNNSLSNDIFVDAKSEDKNQRHRHLSDEIKNIEGGQLMVIDIASLDEQMQCLVFGDVSRAVYELKNGIFEPTDRSSNKPIPKKIIIFVDELNKYAPAKSPKSSPLLTSLLDITERGRQKGIILFSAEQFRSAIHERATGNSSTNAYGRTNAIEVSKPDYRYIPKVFTNMMTRLGKGDLIIQHPVFKSLLKVSFPYPCYRQGGDE
jgi:DNA helicase HerA-like ATPase